MGSTIYHNTSIGKVSKVGGEIENSIIHSYSNKQHHGFLGNSYLGSWVNLGAGTTNSDLKNNYSTIKVRINDKLVDSGKQFVGLTMGDHSKSAINTSFNTGAIVGVSSNVFGGTFPPRYLPSFSWGGSEALTTYDLDRSIEAAERVMQRRNVILTDINKELFKTVFNLTVQERRYFGYPK
jgi:UDP-N-acetylglucosamine diphosphorylase/glucosamine-1-phosphate N-acetyltransferase